MADSLNIIGAAGSIASIVVLLRKTVSTLHTLHSRWKEADFTFINLIAQLTALKAALSKLQGWMDTDMNELHHQLVMDLEVSVTCCRMLVRRIDSEIEDLQQNNGVGLDAQNKMKLIVKHGSLEELQKMVDRQMNALNLLLTVCSCEAISEQKIMLEKTSTRKIFQRVKDNTSSLYVQRDSTSICSRCTDNLSKLSKKFEFDRELFISKVYEKALRGSMKDTVENIRRVQQQSYLLATPKERHNNRRNRLVGCELEKNAKNQKKVCKALILGDQHCAQAFIWRMKMERLEGFTYEECMEYQEIMMNNIIRVMGSMAWVINNRDIDLDENAKMHAKVFSQEIDYTNFGVGRMTFMGAAAVQGLLENRQFVETLSNYELHVPKWSPYFIEMIHRITQYDYLLTAEEMLKLGSAAFAKEGIQEHIFTDGLSLSMLDISSQRSEKKKWFHQFEDIDSIIFFVDLSQYDEIIFLDESSKNKLMENLFLFDSVVNSQWLSHASIILLFRNIGPFKEKLESKPLSNYFPDYEDGNHVNEASGYFLSRFERINRLRLHLYPHFSARSHDDTKRFVWSAARESLHTKMLFDNGLL